MKIYGVVVLYHPFEEVLENINTYINEIDTLYVVDNSDVKNKSLVQELKKNNKIIYINNNGNQGIAHALNVGAKLAIGGGASWLLTMDQDSKFDNGTLKVLIQNIDLKYGIISPAHFINERENIDALFYNNITMTSGNLLNLKLYQSVGPFDEELFIDCVDTEYCLRLYEKNIKIKRVNEVVLNHNLGDIQKKLFFSVTNHNYIRRYYISRNRFYVWNKYKKIFPEYIKFEKTLSFKEVITILLGEKNKLKNIKMILLGYIDYRKKIFGKFNH